MMFGAQILRWNPSFHERLQRKANRRYLSSVQRKKIIMMTPFTFHELKYSKKDRPRDERQRSQHRFQQLHRVT